ncbi:MAG: transglutaminase-like domain-containing protein, partial [Methanobacteriaceae archaeon]
MLIGIILLITVLSISAVSAATVSDSNLSNNKNTSITKSNTVITTKNTDIVSNNINIKTTIVKPSSSKNAAGGIVGKAAAGETKPTSLSHSSILSGASSVSTYVKKNGKLPNSITINKYKFSMPEFLYLLTKATENTYKNNKNSIEVKYDINNPKKASGANIIKKYFTKADYYDTAKRLSSYITKYKEAPNFASTKIGKMQYQTLIYSYAQILDYYKKYKKLPTKQLVNVKTTSALNKNLPKYTRTNDPNPTPTPTPSNRNSVSKANILSAASSIKDYIDVNKKLPDSVTINGFKYSMAEYSYLISKLVYNINSGKTSNIVLGSVANPSGPGGDNAVGNMTKANYIDLAKRYSEFIENNNQAPNYAKAVIDSKNINMQYQTIIYGLSIILDQTKETGTLKDSLDIDVLKNSTINNYKPIYIGPSKVSDKYNGESLEQYLVATRNCQVNNSAIKSTAESLIKGLNTDAEKAVAIFNYVRDKVIYSFYYDTKKGAAGTLSAKSGNCVDQAHLLIA